MEKILCEYLFRYGTYARPFFCCLPKAFIQFAKASKDLLILAPSLNFLPALFVSEALSLNIPERRKTY